MQKTHELRPYVVLVGPVGVGKSTLAQKLMVRRRREGAGTQGFGWSATKKSTKYSATMFDFADTPGLKSRKEKVDHAVNIVLALTERPVSRIFVLVKYSERLDDFCNEAELVVRPFHPWKDLMTVIVTHWDKSDQSEDCKKAIEQALKEELCTTSVLYTSKRCLGSDIEARMKRTLVKTPRSIDMDFDHMFAYFDLKKNDLASMDYIHKKTEVLSNLITMSKQTAEGFEHEDDKRSGFLFYSQVALKGLVEQWKAEFCSKFFIDDLQPEDYACLDTLNSSLRDIFRAYRAYCLQFLKYSAGTDNYRKCPYCGEVWVKIEGCNGTTECAARPETTGRPYETVWSWVSTDEGIAYLFECVEFSGAAKRFEAGAGCGLSLAWEDMQPVQVDPALFEALDTVKDADDATKVPVSNANLSSD